MTPEEFRTFTDFERNLKPGDRVELRWTNSGNVYRAPATLKTVSKSSVRGVIDKEIPIPGGGTAYSAGREIVVPRLTVATMNRWSQNNGVFPMREAVERIVNSLIEGRDISYRYAMLWNTPGYHVEPMAWKTGEYGRPNDANLARYMQATLKAMEPGGFNAHLSGMKIVSAEIRDGITGPVVARWKAS